MTAVGVLVLLAVVLAAISLIPQIAQYPLLSVSIILLGVAVYLIGGK